MPSNKILRAIEQFGDAVSITRDSTLANARDLQLNYYDKRDALEADIDTEIQEATQALQARLDEAEGLISELLDMFAPLAEVCVCSTWRDDEDDDDDFVAAKGLDHHAHCPVPAALKWLSQKEETPKERA